MMTHREQRDSEVEIESEEQHVGTKNGVLKDEEYQRDSNERGGQIGLTKAEQMSYLRVIGSRAYASRRRLIVL